MGLRKNTNTTEKIYSTKTEYTIEKYTNQKTTYQKKTPFMNIQKNI